MVTQRLSLLIAAFIVTVQAAPKPIPHSQQYIHPANGICEDYTITQVITAPLPVFGRAPFENNLDVAEWLTNQTRLSTDGYTPTAFTGFKNATRSYTTSGTFCSPKELKGGKETTVLVATHGVMYDSRSVSWSYCRKRADPSRYWASSFKPEEYNFVQHALNEGYSVFYYDRVGTGRSEMYVTRRVSTRKGY
jgi:hypothetical protein